jgi:hypothetical protein
MHLIDGKLPFYAASMHVAENKVLQGGTYLISTKK